MGTINLYRMRRMIRETGKLMWKIERTQAYATKSSASLSAIPWGRGNRSCVEDGAIQLIELKDAYHELLDELGKMRTELDPLISRLENADDRAVMRLRYIQGFRPEDIAKAIYMTDRMVYYILKRSENCLVRMFPDLFSEFQ